MRSSGRRCWTGSVPVTMNSGERWKRCWPDRTAPGPFWKSRLRDGCRRAFDWAAMKWWSTSVSGGMGDVYRALDTKLNRSVAIKVLSADVADASARRRFQREAQMASSLNHPHILTVHDAGEFEGRQ